MAVEYITKNAPDGSCMGLRAAEKIAFYGTTPIVQPAPAVSASSVTGAANASATGAANASATATVIAAPLPSPPPNVDEDGITAGAFIDRATRRTLVTAVINLITHSTEIDLDYEALLVDVNLIRAQADKSTVDVGLILAQADKSTTDVAGLVAEIADLRAQFVALGLIAS